MAPFRVLLATVLLSVLTYRTKNIDVTAIWNKKSSSILNRYIHTCIYICVCLFVECVELVINLKKCVISKCYFLRKADSTEHPSRGCPHLVLISQQSRLKQRGKVSCSMTQHTVAAGVRTVDLCIQKPTS